MVAFLFACQLCLTFAEFFLWPLVGIGVFLLFGHPLWGQEVLILAGLLLGLTTLADGAIERWGDATTPAIPPPPPSPSQRSHVPDDRGWMP